MTLKKITPRRFTRRRIRSVALMILALSVFALMIMALNQTLNHGSHVSGYVLFGALVFLAAFNLRKKLTFLPMLGTAKMWMQLHIYVGISTFIMFGLHIGWRVPDGWLEGTLATTYLVVFFSGVYGLYITRAMPKRLTNLPQEVIYEQIPQFRRRLATRARELVLSVANRTDVLAKFYANRLAKFFEQSRSVAYAVAPTTRHRRQLVNEINELDRYLDDDERLASRELVEIVKQKDDLDYHRVVQGRLKVWLFIHIALTYSLLTFSVLHGVMAHAFSGGLR